MDVEKYLKELYAERAANEKAIRALEDLRNLQQGNGKRRGRPPGSKTKTTPDKKGE